MSIYKEGHISRNQTHLLVNIRLVRDLPAGLIIYEDVEQRRSFASKTQTKVLDSNSVFNSS